MTGKLKLKKYSWFVEYMTDGDTKIVPLHKKDSNLTMDYDNSIVEFNLVDEFTNPELFTDVPWGESVYTAKLI